MRKRNWIILLCIAFGLCIALVFVLFYRAPLRLRFEEATRPALPAAQPFFQTNTGDVRAPFMAPAAVIVASDPASVHLAVPFLSQAPTRDWGMPYQETCEEASMLMVDAFFRGKKEAFSPEEGNKLLLDLLALEDRMKKTPDLSAVEVGEVFYAGFNYKASVEPLTSADDLKRVLAQGYPVIVPAYGKALKNPHFHNGGSIYHMLVVTGYVKDRFITNDPGTKYGKDFTYSMDNLLKAAHDWNNGDVIHGKPVMIVAKPR